LIIYNEPVIAWAEAYFGRKFTNARAIGFEENGVIQGGVIFDEFKTTMDGKPLSMESTVVTLTKSWITRYNLDLIFNYAFACCKVERLEIRCGRYELKKRRLVERLGFTFEGILREAWPFGGDCAMYSLLQSEWKNGFIPFTASSTRSNNNGSSPDSIKPSNGALPNRA
jgi:hypothetical protein